MVDYKKLLHHTESQIARALDILISDIHGTEAEVIYILQNTLRENENKIIDAEPTPCFRLRVVVNE